MAPIPAHLTDLLTVAEVADMFRVSDETIHRWCRVGELPYLNLPGGGLKRFRRSDVEAILAGQPERVA